MSRLASQTSTDTTAVASRQKPPTRHNSVTWAEARNAQSALALDPKSMKTSIRAKTPALVANVSCHDSRQSEVTLSQRRCSSSSHSARHQPITPLKLATRASSVQSLPRNSKRMSSTSDASRTSHSASQTGVTSHSCSRRTSMTSRSATLASGSYPDKHCGLTSSSMATVASRDWSPCVVCGERVQDASSMLCCTCASFASFSGLREGESGLSCLRTPSGLVNNSNLARRMVQHVMQQAVSSAPLLTAATDQMKHSQAQPTSRPPQQRKSRSKLAEERVTSQPHVVTECQGVSLKSRVSMFYSDFSLVFPDFFTFSSYLNPFRKFLSDQPIIVLNYDLKCVYCINLNLTKNCL